MSPFFQACGATALVALPAFALTFANGPTTTPASTLTQARIPLCAGLTIVTAIDQPEGDYESIKSIESIADGAVRLKYSAERPERSVRGSAPRLRKYTVYRDIPIADLARSTLYLQQFHERAPVKVPGTTAIGTSAAVLRSLKTTGAAELGIFNPLSGEMSADPKKHPSVYDYQMVDTIARVEREPVMMPLTVNGARVELPAIHARGDYVGDKSEFFFLDDESNPIALRFRIGIGAIRVGGGASGAKPADRDTLQVVKIAYRCAGPATTIAAPRISMLEQALEKAGRVDVYDIYFSFNSDVIRDESKPTLDELGDLLHRHPDWRLAIEGHTDNIASDTYNLDLSQRRAAAVKNALVGGYAIDASRLTTAGYGESRPKDTNDTLEGRARNRRVELVRRS
jgi:outer membrane protein OmpA-like peptidoglycan-associated protein